MERKSGFWGFFFFWRGRGMRFSLVSFCLSRGGQISWKQRCVNRLSRWIQAILRCHCSTNKTFSFDWDLELNWMWKCGKVTFTCESDVTKHAISCLSSRAFVLLLWSLFTELVFTLHWITALGKITFFTMAFTTICSFNDLQITCVTMFALVTHTRWNDCGWPQTY